MVIDPELSPELPALISLFFPLYRIYEWEGGQGGRRHPYRLQNITVLCEKESNPEDSERPLV